MKHAIALTAVLAMTLGLVGCSCHKPPPPPMNDNSAYQSCSSSKLNGKLGRNCKKCKHCKHAKKMSQS